jgi:putative ABC transport system permease protein
MGTIGLTLQSAWARKRRLVGTTTAVLLGVAFLAATLVLGDTAKEGFARLFGEVNAGTDVVVRSETRFETESGVETAPLDLALVDQVRAVDGITTAVGLVEGTGQVLAADGTPLGGEGPPTIAGGWVDDPELSPMTLVEGRGPEAPGEVVLDRGTAEDGELAVGDTTTVLVPEPVPVTVVGIATFGDDDSMAGATYAAFEPTVASELLLGAPDRISSVIAGGADGADQEALAARVAAVLPDGLEAITGAELTAEQEEGIEEDFLGFMEMFLLVFAGVALLVATSSIHNTASILVAQRTRESALLRAVGASRSQVLTSTILEAGIVGLVGALVGAGAGVGLAAGLRALLEAGDLGLPADELVVSGGALAWSAGVGLVLSLLASLTPAIKASRVPPVAAMRDVALEEGGSSRWRAAVGIGMAVVGGAMVVGAADAESALATAGLGALLVMVGVILLGPVVARPLSAVLGAPLALRGVTGRLAKGGAQRNPRRTSSTAAALLVGVGVVTTFTVLADSLSSSIEDAVDQSFAGELVVESAGFSGAGLDAAFAEELEALPEVEVTTGLGDGVVVLDGEEANPTVADLAALSRLSDFDVEDGDLAAVTDGGIAMSRQHAEDHGWTFGESIPIEFADGTATTVRIDALYGDRALGGDLLLPAETWAQHTTRTSSFAVLVGLADGVDLEAGRAAVERVAAGYGSPDVLDRDQFIAENAAQIDQILAVVYGLLLLAIVIALLGIAGTLSLSIHERTRELGLLRAVGLDRRQLRRIVRGEAMIVSLLGTVGGVGIGVFVGWGLIRAAAADEGLGTFTVPTGELAVVLLLGALAGVVAAVRPARRAAKLPVLDALTAT